MTAVATDACHTLSDRRITGMSAADLIEGYMAHLRERSCTRATLDAYTYQLDRADKDLPFGLDTSTEQEIRAWIWRGDLKQSSRAIAHSAVTGFFKWATKAGWVDFDPTTEIPHPRVRPGIPRVATDEHVEMLVGYAREPYRLQATLAAYAGLRCIEVHRQRREEITEQHVRIFGKGDKPRVVPTHEVLWAAVKDLPPGPLTTAVSQRQISTNFQRYCVREAQIPMSMHPLRAWFATTMYRRTKDLQAVSTLLGHASLATTARYLGMREDEMIAAVNALPTLGAVGAASDRRDRRARSAPQSQPLGGTDAPVADDPDGLLLPPGPRPGVAG